MIPRERELPCAHRPRPGVDRVWALSPSAASKSRDTVNIRRRFRSFARGFVSAETFRADGQAAAAPPQAVFLHGGWRCGSTYVWNRFRDCAETVCFYEPFHEGLARLTAAKIRRDTTQTWNSRHPLLDRPYWAEYHALLRRGGLRGIRGYRQEFAVNDYFPTERGLAPQLDYIRQLMREAHRTGKRPVLGFSRSLARAAAIKQALGGWHVMIQRDPRQQWLSCRSYRVGEGSLYFELCHFLILALAPPQSSAARYARYLGLPRPSAGRFRDQFRFMKRALWPWTDELSYRAFIGVLQLSYAAAAPAIDLAIDIDRLSNQPRYRNEVRAGVFAASGLVMRFDDCRMGSHDALSVDLDFAEVESDVLRMLRTYGVKTAELSPALEVPDCGARRSGGATS